MAAIRQPNNNWLWYIDKKSFAVSDSTTQSPLARSNENLTVSMSKQNQFLLPGKSIKPMKIGCIYVKKKRKTKTNNFPKKQNKTIQYYVHFCYVLYGCNKHWNPASKITKSLFKNQHFQIPI